MNPQNEVCGRKVLLFTLEPATHKDLVNNTSNKWPRYQNI